MAPPPGSHLADMMRRSSLVERIPQRAVWTAKCTFYLKVPQDTSKCTFKQQTSLYILYSMYSFGVCLYKCTCVIQVYKMVFPSVLQSTNDMVCAMVHLAPHRGIKRKVNRVCFKPTNLNDFTFCKSCPEQCLRHQHRQAQR